MNFIRMGFLWLPFNSLQSRQPDAKKFLIRPTLFFWIRLDLPGGSSTNS